MRDEVHQSACPPTRFGILTSPVTDAYLSRFAGIGRLYGTAALENFSQSRVMVVGIGGVGSWAVEALARSGVGALVLVDLDDICITNTNRQIHALTHTVGKSKAAALAERLKEINPEIAVEVQQAFYTAKSSQELLLAQKPDLVLDAIDAVQPKCHLLATCHENGIPVITSGGAGGRTDATRITLDDLARTHNDALLQAVRKRLRAEYRFPRSGKKIVKFHIPAVFSAEPPLFPQCDGSTSTERPEETPAGLKCDAGYGAATHLTATFGNIMAGWALKTLAES